MLATSSDLMWWTSRSGEQYQNENVKASQRKHIVRYFRYADNKEFQAWKPILEAQKAALIEVWTAPLKGELADYVVVDDQFAGKLVLALNRDPIRAEFYFD